MNLLIQFAETVFSLFLELAPILLTALIIVGQLRSWIPEEKIFRWLGGDGISPTLKAILIGIPLPLCSCSVVPVSSQLKKIGIANGTIVAFLISAPPIGISSMMVSVVLFGYRFTAFRVATIAITALVLGLVVHTVTHSSKDNKSCKSEELPPQEGWQKKISHGLRVAKDELRDVKTPFLIAISLASIVSTFMPTTWLPSLEAKVGMLGAVILAFLIIIPANLCAVDSAPIIASMMACGLSPGLSLIFLTAGPALGSFMLNNVHKRCGAQVLCIYSIGVASCSIIAGLLLSNL